MIGSIELLDTLLAVIGVTFSLVLLPALIKGSTKFSRWSSGLTGLAVLTQAFVFADLGLPFAAASALLNGIVWLALFVWRRDVSTN